MVATMEQLMKAKKIAVLDWQKVTYVREPLVEIEQYIESKYIFSYKDETLWINGDVFGKEKRTVKNANHVLFHLAKGSKNVLVQLVEGIEFILENPSIEIQE